MGYAPRAEGSSARGIALAAYTPMQGHCTTWLRYRIAAATMGELPTKEAGMFLGDRHTLPETADATMISYTLLRHLGCMLDELSAQGLTLWQDTGQRWRWAWAATAFQSERGFWSIGEAIVDAVVTRYPTAFDTTGSVECEREEQRTA